MQLAFIGRQPVTKKLQRSDAVATRVMKLADDRHFRLAVSSPKPHARLPAQIDPSQLIPVRQHVPLMRYLEGRGTRREHPLPATESSSHSSGQERMTGECPQQGPRPGIRLKASRQLQLHHERHRIVDSVVSHQIGLKVRQLQGIRHRFHGSRPPFGSPGDSKFHLVSCDFLATQIR